MPDCCIHLPIECSLSLQTAGRAAKRVGRAHFERRALSVWKNTELHKHKETGRARTAQMTTTVAGVYRFEWYALAPACFAAQGGKSQRGQQGRERDCHASRRNGTRLPARNVLHDFLFASEGGLLPSVDVAVRLGEEEGDEVDPRPRLFALQFPVVVWGVQSSALNRVRTR